MGNKQGDNQKGHLGKPREVGTLEEQIGGTEGQALKVEDAMQAKGCGRVYGAR